MITISCQCGKTYKVDDRFAGRRTRCAQCGCEIIVPSADAAQQQPQPDATSSFAEPANESGPTESYIPSPPPHQSSSHQQGDTSRPASTTGEKSQRQHSEREYGSYRKMREHAHGGMGQISIARDENLKREVALKELNASATDRKDIVRRFHDEAEITARLEHPGIVPVHAFGTDGKNRPYYTMKFVRGKTFQDAIKEFHTLPDKAESQPSAFRDLVRRFAAVCQTMSFAHEKGIIHRDLKPVNIMLGEHGETLVMDWGLAKPHSENDDGTLGDLAAEKLSNRPEMTAAGKIVGTPAYMSPEQAAGDLLHISPQSDIYSLGVILFQMLTDQLPYTGKSSLEIVQKVLNEESPRPSEVTYGVPKGLDAICVKAMAREQSDRYFSAAAMFRDLTNWLDDEPISARKDTRWEKTWRWIRKNRALATTLLLSTFALLIVLGVCGMMLERARVKTVAAMMLADDYRQKAAEATQLADAKEKLIQQKEADLKKQQDKALALAQRIMDLESDVTQDETEILSLNAELETAKAVIAAMTDETLTLQREMEELRQLAAYFMQLAAGQTDFIPPDTLPEFSPESDWTKGNIAMFDVLCSDGMFGMVSHADQNASTGGRNPLRVDYVTDGAVSLICPIQPTPDSRLDDMRQLKFSLFVPEPSPVPANTVAFYQPVAFAQQIAGESPPFRELKIRIGCGSNYFESRLKSELLAGLKPGQWNDVVISLRERTTGGVDNSLKNFLSLEGQNREKSHWFELIATPGLPGSYYMIDDLRLSREIVSIVVTTADVVDANDGVMSLREALLYADDGDTITFAPSLHGQTITLGGTEMLINKNITIDGTGANITIDADKKSRIFNITSGAEVELVGLTLKGGMANRGAVNDSGGAIFMNGVSLIVSYSKFTGNEAEHRGGAIYLHSSPTVTVTECEFIDNLARVGPAIDAFNSFAVTISQTKFTDNHGAICAMNMGKANLTVRHSVFIGNSASGAMRGAIFASSPIFTVSQCEFTNNSAYMHEGGGAIYMINPSTATISQSEFTGNKARLGGAIYLIGAPTDTATQPTVSILQCVLTNNSADFFGGAIYMNAGVSATVSESEFSGNSAIDNNGGAIYATDSSTSVTVSQSKFAGNSAGVYGGAIDVNEAFLTVSECVFTDNMTVEGGGAIGCVGNTTVSQSVFTHNKADRGAAVRTWGGPLTVTNSTITRNTANIDGGGIFNFKNGNGTTTLFNTIVTANSSPDIFRESGTIQGHNNLTSPFDWDGDSGNNFVYDPNLPLFVDAANGDYRLARNSQAIDRGNNQYALDAGMIEDSRDLSDNPRFNGTNIDIGAFEF